MNEMNTKVNKNHIGITRQSNLERLKNPGKYIVIHRTVLGAITLLIALALTACSASPSSTSSSNIIPPTTAPQATLPPTRVPQPTLGNTPQNTAAPAATSTELPSAVVTQLDPCVLIDSQAASALAGVTFGAGVESTTPEGLKMCTYGGQTTNVFTVDVVQAPDVATAQAAKQQFLADLQANLEQLTSQGLNITQLPNFADGAVMANANVDSGGISISGNAMGFLKGTVFVGFSDIALSGTAPSDEAMQAEATTVLGMLP
jgi:hypothetical protein